MKQSQQEWLRSEVGRDKPISGFSIKRLVQAELSAACGISGSRFGDKEYLMPRLSRRQLFGMMRITAPESALAVICGQGITSAQEVEAFLRDHGLQSLLVDNTASVDEAISRQADLTLFIDVIAEQKVGLWRYPIECSWADLAELYGTSLRDMEIDYLLADGGNTWSYIKSIGISNVFNYGEELLALENRYTPSEVKMLVKRSNFGISNPLTKYRPKTTKRERLASLIAVANRLGVQATVKLSVPSVFNIIEKTSKKAPDVEACTFLDEYIKLLASTTREPDYASAYSYHEVGFNAEEAVRLVNEGISPERAAAIRDGAVVAAVSSGWL